MEIRASSIVALALTLVMAGCTTPAVEPVGPERVNLSYEELSAIDGYNDLLVNSCDSTLNDALSNLSFLPIGENVSGPPPAEVMKTRTLRILDAIGDEPSESAILDESLSWNAIENGTLTSYWTFPSASVKDLVSNSIDENLIPPLFRGETPIKPEVKERVLTEWLSVCGLSEVFSQATITTSNFEVALADLQASFDARYMAQGFTKYQDGLVKMEIVERQINFSYVKTDWCTLVASVTFGGIPDADGLTPGDEIVEFRLDHSREFEEINSSFDIQQESNRTLEFHDLKSGRLTGVRCW